MVVMGYKELPFLALKGTILFLHHDQNQNGR